MNTQIDEFINNASKWQAEMQQIRIFILDCGLTEELKWGSPCYTYNGSNVLIIGGFKDNCVLSFIKGTFLADTDNILSKPGENSQSVRVAKFTNLKDIIALESTLKAYIFEALEVEKAGLKVITPKISKNDFVKELQNKLNSDGAFKTAFEALTPGRQRAYNIHFAGAKQAKTRESRIEANTQRILDGYGFNDCTCGHSKRMPNCDGSHKYL